jgi:hypothetical protein
MTRVGLGLKCVGRNRRRGRREPCFAVDNACMTRAAPAKKQGSPDINASVQETAEGHRQLLMILGKAGTILAIVSMVLGENGTIPRLPSAS